MYSTYVICIPIKARFPRGDFFRAKRLFPLSASLITSANAMPTKEKVASREESRLVENGLKTKYLKSKVRDGKIVKRLVFIISRVLSNDTVCLKLNFSSHMHFKGKFQFFICSSRFANSDNYCTVHVCCNFISPKI